MENIDGKKENCHILEMVLLLHFQKHVMKDKSYNKFYIPWHAVYFIHSVLNKNQVLPKVFLSVVHKMALMGPRVILVRVRPRKRNSFLVFVQTTSARGLCPSKIVYSPNIESRGS